MKQLLFLDFDGTLSSLAPKPHLAILTPKRRALLSKLSKQADVIVAIISGRQLANLKKKVGLPGLFYAGNHGFEISGPGVKLTHPKAARAKPVLKKIRHKLKAELGRLKGVIIEDKGLTLSVHYRLARPADVKKIKQAVRQAIKPYKQIRLTAGKKVLEIRPNIAWDKGRAVLWFIKELGRHMHPIYIGDDTTDEDAFRALKKKGTTIRVGRARHSLAKRFFKDVNQVWQFLRTMLK